MIEYIGEFIVNVQIWVLVGLWRALPLVVIVLCVDLFLRRRIAARFHCVLWGLVLARMLCPVSIESPISMHGMIDQVAEHALATSTERAPVETGPDLYTFVDENGESRTVSLPLYEATPDQPDVALGIQIPQSNSAYYTEDSTPQSISSPESLPWEIVIAFVIVGTWLIVACGLLLRGVVQYIKFAVSLRSTDVVTDQPVVDQVLRVCDQLRVSRRPAIREVDGIAVPAVFGILRHTICLPTGSLSQLCDKDLRLILLHEVAHIKRRDSLVLSLAIFVRSLHWFNPFAWLLVSRLRQHMEQAADDLATRNTSQQSLVDYGRLLLKYASEPSNVRTPATMGLLFVSAQKHLKQRIELLDHNSKRNHWVAKVVAGIIVVVVGGTGLTDASTMESKPQSETEWLAPHVSVDPPPAIPKTDEPPRPKSEVTYDVRKVLKKLEETISSGSAEHYLTSIFPPEDAARLEDGQLTLVQTAEQHKRTLSQLHAWERSGAYQITLEFRVISADLELVRDVNWGAQAVLPNSGSPNQPFEKLQTELKELSDMAGDPTNGLRLESHDATVRSRPALAAKISRLEAAFLIRRIQQDAESNMMFAPKVTLFNGQVASITDEVQRPFVTGVQPGSGNQTAFQPIIEVVSKGWRFGIRAEVTEDEDVDLLCNLTETKIMDVELANLPFRLKNNPSATTTVQVPNVAKTSVNSSVRLKDGESLLIVSPATYKDTESTKPTNATFYLITPHAMSEASLVHDENQ